MAINSHDVKAVVHDQCFFMDFDFVCGDEVRDVERMTYPVIYYSVYGEHNDANFEPVHHCILKLYLFC